MGLKLKLQYFINDSYNQWYIHSRRIKDHQPVALTDFNNKHPSKDFAQPYMSVWLRNISRIIRATNLTAKDFKELHFLDVGCGRGVSTLYAREKFKFATVSGFDFEEDLIRSARENLKYSNLPEKSIQFFVADAAEIVLEPKRYFLFLFNPFTAPVMETFLKHNIQMLKDTGSILGYANCREIDVIKQYNPKSIIEIPKYRCVTIKF